MKIINRGSDPLAAPIRSTCTRCYTEIEFLPSEAKHVSDQRDGDFYQIKCPVCPAIITHAVPSRYNGPG